MKLDQYKKLKFTDPVQIADTNGNTFGSYFVSDSVLDDCAIIAVWKPDWNDIHCLSGRQSREIDDFKEVLKDKSILHERSTNDLDLYFNKTNWGFAILNIDFLKSYNDLSLKAILFELENEVK